MIAPAENAAREEPGVSKKELESLAEPSSSNLAFVEQLYFDFQRDPSSVGPEWKEYFEAISEGKPQETLKAGPSFRATSTFGSAAFARPTEPREISDGDSLQHRVFQLVRNYRVRGHNIAAVDPLGLPRPHPPELELSYFGLSEADLDREVDSETLQSPGRKTIREILEVLRDTYCRSIGVQYMHIDNIEIRRWLQSRMEGTSNRLQLTRDEQVRILTRLTDAVMFEEFVRKKFVGAKSFSLEGCESLIPLLDLAIDKAAEQGLREIVFGMAHRGRLNVLANIIGKHPREIFREFSDAPGSSHRDVKYHLGYSNEWTTASGKGIHLSLCFNPSHLEFVSPVALGRVRAKQDRSSDVEGAQCMGIIIHGDASFAAQGMVQETFNLSQLQGYSVGGTLHIVVNNQIGFTTSPSQGRSSLYPTDVARMLQIPIFHVNGEDPEAVAQVVRLAMDFRRVYKRDVVIDMYGYRRLGHSEGDEPSFTQPVLYRTIERRKSVREGYLEHLLSLGGVTREEADEIAMNRHQALEKEFSEAQMEKYQPPPKKVLGVWSRNAYFGGPVKNAEEVITGVPKEKLAVLLEKQTVLPQEFHPHPKIKKLLDSRRAMSAGKEPLDWAAAEALAFASICVEGFRIRVSGEDCARGTFSQRHAVLYDYEDGHFYTPLRHLEHGQAPVDFINSPLSESGVLGFDYGYSLDCPDGLTCWEAQFGDFVNAAQVIVDQFIASAEVKWNRLSGIVLLLPHGLEGQGPEHSSARLERFLELAAQDNIQIVSPTTPAQYFHLLRRQVLRRWRKPLVITTPKSLLRNPRATSSLFECAEGSFQHIIGEPTAVPAQQVRRVILCNGKIFYDLQAYREKSKQNDVALIRIEQLYPLDDTRLQAALLQYAAKPIVWVQDEPENMGAWPYFRTRYGDKMLGRPFSGIYRDASPSAAAGSERIHKQEQQELMKQAFGV